MNKYKIKYYYPYEMEIDEKTFVPTLIEYEILMYDVDEIEVRKKFKSKYPHTEIIRVFIEKDGLFQVPGRRKRINKTTYVPGKGIIHII